MNIHASPGDRMLSKTQVDCFYRDGFLVVPDVLSADRLARIKAEYGGLLDRLYAQWFDQGRVTLAPDGLTFFEKLLVSYKAGCDWFQPFDISLPGDEIHADTPMHFGPAVFDMVVDSNILDAVQALIGGEITSNPIQHIRIKPPAPDLAAGENRAHITATDWHQDRGVGLQAADNTEMITCWLAISDATVENGCLQAIPGAHREMLPHCPKVQTAIADGFVDAATAVPLPVPAGGMVMFHPLTPHSSLVNHTDGFRWSFDLRYNVTGQNTGRAHFPDFVARSLADPAHELRDWQVWQSMWETTRAELAASPHIPIHRWNSDAPYCA